MTIRRRTKIIVVLVALVAVGVWVWVPNNKAKRQAEGLRRDLREGGFRTEVSEFTWSIPEDARSRAETLIGTAQAVSDSIPSRGMIFFQPVGSNAAIVLSKEEKLSTEVSADHWPEFRSMVETHKMKLDTACET